MVSVVTAAPTGGAPLVVLHELTSLSARTHGNGLNYGAKLFVFDEPTVHVDAGAKVGIYRLFAYLLAKGARVTMVSSYLPKVYKLAGALHVFRAGGLAASHGHKGASQDTILTEAIGV